MFIEVEEGVGFTKDKLWYLASPYSDPNAEIMHDRYVTVTIIGAQLFKAGYHFIYPITSSVAMADLAQIGGTFATWESLDYKYIDACAGIVICTNMPGWTRSVGVLGEAKYALKTGKKIYLLNIFDDALCITEKLTVDWENEKI